MFWCFPFWENWKWKCTYELSYISRNSSGNSDFFVVAFYCVTRMIQQNVFIAITKYKDYIYMIAYSWFKLWNQEAVIMFQQIMRMRIENDPLSVHRCLCCSSGDPAAEEWSQWSVCSLTCGQGWQVRTRSCVSSPYGTLCSGALRETRMCNNTASCPGEPGITGSGMFTELSIGCQSALPESSGTDWLVRFSPCESDDASVFIMCSLFDA